MRARGIGSAVAALSVVGLASALVVPTSFNAVVTEEEFATQQAQALSSTDIEISQDLLQGMGSVDISAIPTKVFEAEQGDLGQIELRSTDLRYPFDEQVLHTSGFGYRSAPVAEFHAAQDFGTPAGVPIRIVGSGIVIQGGFTTDGCGWGLTVQHNLHGKKMTSRYCHMEMNSHSWQVGDRVEMGDTAGTVGNTGMSFGPHLHLALEVEGEPLDPLKLIAEYSATK